MLSVKRINWQLKEQGQAKIGLMIQCKVSRDSMLLGLSLLRCCWYQSSFEDSIRSCIMAAFRRMVKESHEFHSIRHHSGHFAGLQKELQRSVLIPTSSLPVLYNLHPCDASLICIPIHRKAPSPHPISPFAASLLLPVLSAQTHLLVDNKFSAHGVASKANCHTDDNPYMPSANNAF